MKSWVAEGVASEVNDFIVDLPKFPWSPDSSSSFEVRAALGRGLFMLRISSAFEGPTEWGRDDSLEALVPSRAESRYFTI